jgi:hypothetical protein
MVLNGRPWTGLLRSLRIKALVPGSAAIVYQVSGGLHILYY